MKRTLLFAALSAGMLISCQDAADVVDQLEDEVSTEIEDLEEEEETETTEELAAINDESKHVEGAIECITQQYALVQEGKFDEALEYYSAKIKAKMKAKIDEDPSITEQWKAGTNVPDEMFEEIIESIKEDPGFFVFEDGMWRMNQK
ncbi:MAG: hypothetical protein P8P74_08370 [Crocinitomicaceae bacterium]|nr:hypothetical protein [Crocinitomicaceae bacterium]